MKRIVILISGRGSNMQALLQVRLPAQISAVISDEPNAAGLQIATQHGVDTEVVSHARFSERAAFDAALAEATLGEICGALREEWGGYSEAPAF